MMNAELTPSKTKHPSGLSDEWLKTIRPFDPPVANAAGGGYFDVYCEYEQLRDFVLDSLPASDPLRQAFVKCKSRRGICTRNDISPNVQTLTAVIDAFYDLPEKERKRILNGWNVPPEYLRVKRSDDAENSSIQTGLEFMLSSGPTARVAEKPDFIQYTHDCTCPVRVTVKLGTRKMEAANLLRDLADAIEYRWEKMIDISDGEEAADIPERVSQSGAREGDPSQHPKADKGES